MLLTCSHGVQIVDRSSSATKTLNRSPRRCANPSVGRPPVTRVARHLGVCRYRTYGTGRDFGPSNAGGEINSRRRHEHGNRRSNVTIAAQRCARVRSCLHPLLDVIFAIAVRARPLNPVSLRLKRCRGINLFGGRTRILFYLFFPIFVRLDFSPASGLHVHDRARVVTALYFIINTVY